MKWLKGCFEQYHFGNIKMDIEAFLFARLFTWTGLDLGQTACTQILDMLVTQDEEGLHKYSVT